MLLLFSSRALEDLCADERLQGRKLGAAGARKLRARLADLLAVATVSDLGAGSPHPLVADRAGQFAVNLDGGRRLVFEAADDPVPRTDSGAIDWRAVRAVRIVYIGDYHA